MTYATLSFYRDIQTEKAERKDNWALLLAVPLAVAVFSIFLAAEFPAFAGAVALVGLE